jgi:asparagine synthase
VGPIAGAILRRHGVLWPFNTHFHKPLLAKAAGGSMLTGIGGDELFGTSPSRVSLLLAGRIRPNRRDVARLGLAFGPRRLRSALLARRIPMHFPWLLEGAQRQLAAAWGRQAAAEPHRWRDQVQWWRRLRYFRIGLASLDLLADDEGVNIVHPFAAAPVASALVHYGGKVGPTDRAASMKLLFGELLPGVVLDRRTKAQFDAVFWNRHSRTFVAAWEGEGVDPQLTDLDALRALWSSPDPPAQTFTQLQAAWLAGSLEAIPSTPDRGEQHVGRGS